MLKVTMHLNPRNSAQMEAEMLHRLEQFFGLNVMFHVREKVLTVKAPHPAGQAEFAVTITIHVEESSDSEEDLRLWQAISDRAV